MTDIVFKVNPKISSEQLNVLFASAWEDYRATDFLPVLKHSLLYVCAYQHDDLVGFVNVAWDGGIHAFLLDTTVHHDFQRQGIGKKLVLCAISAIAKTGIEWLHVDYEPHLQQFYEGCGFNLTQASILNLKR